MGTQGAQKKILPTLHPNTIFQPSPAPNTHPDPQPSRNPTPTPSPNPTPSSNPSRSRNLRLGFELLLKSKTESNGFAKAAIKEFWGMLFSLINMAGMAGLGCWHG